MKGSGKEVKEVYDAILVLGVSKEEKLFKNRVDKAVKLYKQGSASKIIFSGRWWGGLKKKQKITEAKLMSRYAVQQGVSTKDILLEERSLNTAGNFYFTKKQIFKPKNIKRIFVISHSDHFPKAKYLARKILGKEYKLTWVSDGIKIRSVSSGHASLAEIKQFFRRIKDGDDEGIAQLLCKHPHYKNYRRI